MNQLPTQNETSPRIHHAKYPPSKLSHWEICPGWENENNENLSANEGTLLHKACETGILTGLDEEQQQVVQLCRRYVSIIEQKTAATKYTELRLDVAGLTWGTGDVILIHGARECSADIVDYKFGRNAVDDAEFNMQGWCYTVGVFTKFPSVSEIKTHFLLPRRNEITSFTFTREDYDRLVLRIATIIAIRKRYEDYKDENLLKATPANCTWCGRKATCSKLHELALRIAPAYDTTFQLPEEYHASRITDPNQMAMAREVADVMGKWAASVKEHATNMVLQGVEIPGWKLSTRQGQTNIQDAQAAFVTAKELAPKLEVEEYLKIVSVSKTALENLVKEHAVRGTKGQVAQLLNSKLIGNGIAVRGDEVRYLSRIRD